MIVGTVINSSQGADPLSFISVMAATLLSAGIIYAAFRNSIKHMVERVVDERIVNPLLGVNKRIDEHMIDEERSRIARDLVINNTARDVAYLRGKLERPT